MDTFYPSFPSSFFTYDMPKAINYCNIKWLTVYYLNVACILLKISSLRFELKASRVYVQLSFRGFHIPGKITARWEALSL